jgi:hypothetical protein
MIILPIWQPDAFKNGQEKGIQRREQVQLPNQAKQSIERHTRFKAFA